MHQSSLQPVWPQQPLGRTMYADPGSLSSQYHPGQIHTSPPLNLTQHGMNPLQNLPTNRPSEPYTEPCTISPSDVGASFALQYFRVMKSSPEELYKFYSNDSHICRISVSPTGSLENLHGSGSAQIEEILHKEHKCGPSLDMAIIHSIECQETIAGGVFALFNGTLKYCDETSRDFCMSILLMKQHHLPSSGYYIMNDIFIFFSSPMSLRPTKQPGLYSKSLERMTASPFIKPTPCGLPQLGQSALQLGPSAPQVGVSTSHMGQPPSRTGQSNPQLGQSVTPGATAHQLCKSQLPNEFIENYHPEVISSHHEPTHYKPEIVEEYEASKSTVNQEESIPPAKLTSERIPVETYPAHQETQASSQNKKKESPGLSEDAQTESVLEKSPELNHKKSPESNNQAALPLAKETENTKPMETVVDPSIYASHYSKNSYAGALFASGSVKAPCRVGYSVPNSEPSQKAPEPLPRETSKPSFRSSSNKTLWLSSIPHEMTDEQIKKVISEQLPNGTEQSIIRIDRVANHNHGFIEFDTDSNAKALLSRGLRIEGNQIQIAFSSHGRNKFKHDKHQNSFKKDGSYPQKRNYRNKDRPTQKSPAPPLDEGWMPAGPRRKNRSNSQKDPKRNHEKSDRYDRSKKFTDVVLTVAQPVN